MDAHGREEQQHTWGGWELLLPDDAFDGGFASRTAPVSQAEALGTSLTWHLNNSIKFVANYEATWFQDGKATGDRATEHILFGRVQFAI